jgi:hypothetical protein
MYSKSFALLAVLALSMPGLAQVRPAAEGARSTFAIGGGIDYWRGDWGEIARFGPSAWSTADYWHGLGVISEAHTMIAGGGPVAARYKYFVGEGGPVYNFYHFPFLTPYVKAEAGFAGLSFPHKATSTYAHDTRITWALGAGCDLRVSRRVSTRIDYTYDGFPDFYSPISGLHHTLNPSGVSVGATYHFR